jgi:acyl-CoA carboxylase subunit alpha
VLGTLPSGWRNVVSAPQRVSFADGERAVEVGYRLARDGLAVTVDGERLDARLVAAAPEAVTLEVGGVRRCYAVHRVAGVAYVDGPDGSSALAELPRFPDPSAAAHAGSLLAPMPGAVVRVLAAEGERVATGQPLVVLEAMKMEHTVAAPADGTLARVGVAAGDQVSTGQVLAVVEEAAVVEEPEETP